MKQQLEIPNIRNSKHTAISIDAEKMYQSIKFGQIQKAVNYFLRKVSKAEKEKAERCLDLVKFGMTNTLITFEDKHYIYGGDLPVEEKVLTIGGFESACFVDLVVAYLLENARQLFKDSRYNGIYRNNGITVISKK